MTDYFNIDTVLNSRNVPPSEINIPQNVLFVDEEKY